METTTIKRKLIEEALDQLKKAQEDAWVQSTQDVIDALEIALKSDGKTPCQPNDIKQARYFYFTFSFSTFDKEGDGDLSFKTKGFFPKKSDVKSHATKAVCEKYNKDNHQVSVVITGWIEMTESDYNNWNAK
jgi:hypothetical protein